MTVTTPLLGVNLTDTPTSNTSGLELGTTVSAADNQEYTLVVAGSAITQYDWIGIDENFSAYPLTKAMADDGWIIGAAQVAFDAGDYGWIATKGANLTGRIGASCAADVALYTSSTAGVLDDTATSQTKIDGAVLVTANASASIRSKEVLLTWPRSSTF